MVKINQTLNLLYALLWLIQGCASDHQLINTPELPLEKDQFITASEPVKRSDPGKWWQLFGDQELNQIIEEGLNNNYSIQSALTLIEQKQAALGAPLAAFFPSLSTGASVTKAQSVSTSSGKPVASQSDSLSVSLSLSYDLDLYGTKQNELSTAGWELVAAFEDLKQLLTETAEALVKAWFLSRELEAQVQLVEENILSDQENLGFITERYQLGLSSLTDVLQAQQQLIASKMQLPGVKIKLLSNEHSLQFLLGRYPITTRKIQPLTVTLQLLEVQPGLPSQLMQRRPDLQAALAKIKVADHRVGVAVAAQFPKISLTASGGTQSDSLGDLVNPSYSIWNLIGNLTLPLFDGDQRKMEVIRRKAILKERVIKYETLLFQAFGQVEENLAKSVLQEKRIALIRDQIKIAMQALRLSMDSYTQGLDTWLSVTSVLTQYQNARKTLITAQRELLDLKISLLVALGGSWTDHYVPISNQEVENQEIESEQL